MFQRAERSTIEFEREREFKRQKRSKHTNKFFMVGGVGRANYMKY
jgi:hypothetical protein